jgi:hypothetical protein
MMADDGGRAVQGVGLWLLECWDGGFESRWGHKCSSLVFVVCYAGSGPCAELHTRSEECYRLCVRVWSRNLNNRVAEARIWLTSHKQKMMGCLGHVVDMGLCNSKGNFCRKTLKDLRVDGRMILKVILDINNMRFWTRLICSKQWPLVSVNMKINFRVPYHAENYWLATRLLAFRHYPASRSYISQALTCTTAVSRLSKEPESRIWSTGLSAVWRTHRSQFSTAEFRVCGSVHLQIFK